MDQLPSGEGKVGMDGKWWLYEGGEWDVYNVKVTK